MIMPCTQCSDQLNMKASYPSIFFVILLYLNGMFKPDLIRCKITTIDQHTGDTASNNEPFRTLSSYRMYEQLYENKDKRFNAPLFGSNYSVLKPGKISVGDNVYIRRAN